MQLRDNRRRTAWRIDGDRTRLVPAEVRPLAPRVLEDHLDSLRSGSSLVGAHLVSTHTGGDADSLPRYAQMRGAVRDASPYRRFCVSFSMRTRLSCSRRTHSRSVGAPSSGSAGGLRSRACTSPRRRHVIAVSRTVAPWRCVLATNVRMRFCIVTSVHRRLVEESPAPMQKRPDDRHLHPSPRGLRTDLRTGRRLEQLDPSRIAR